MITSIHTMLYSDDAPATRAFLRDVLGWPCVEHGPGSGWLIFRSGASEMGVHPTSDTWEGQVYSHPVHHEISLMCDDIQATVADLKAKGVEFKGEIQDQGYGWIITMLVPGAGEMQVYQPNHPTAYDVD
jgi:catechol 2,3-dioxygenase-like lactoylglutathione lyase family enzyme